MVLVEYPTIGSENKKYHVKKEIRNILYENIDIHSRRLITEFPGDRVKCISKLQSYCTNMNFANKSIYDRLFQQVTHKVVESSINYIKVFQNAQDLSVSVGKIYTEYHLMHIFLDIFH